MNLKISILLLIFLLFSCKPETKFEKRDKDILKTNALIEADSLLLIKDQSNLVIIDFRKPEYFKEAHIPVP